MGKGDMKSAKGKRFAGSYGNRRKKKRRGASATITANAEASTAAPKAVKKPAAKKPAAKKTAAKKED